MASRTGFCLASGGPCHLTGRVCPRRECISVKISPKATRSSAARCARETAEEAGFLAGWIEAAGRRGGRGGRSLDDRRSFGGDGVPLGTESEHALALRLAGLLVECVAVERVLVIGHLAAAVASPRR